MKLKMFFAAATMLAFAPPAIATEAHPAPVDHHTLSDADKAKLDACRKLTADAAHHDAVCVKLMAEHPADHK